MHYTSALETLEGCAWYIFNFGEIFSSSETLPNVTKGNEQYSAKLSVKDIAVFSVASSF